MEIQLQELLDQIKRDGVKAAQAEADAIISAANAEAERILASANEKADKAMQAAKAENERLVRSSEEAIRQAGRNLLISFRESVTHELDSIVGEKVKEAYSNDALCALIVSALEAFSKNAETDDISVLMNQKDLDRLQAEILGALKIKMQTGVTLSPSESFDGGFRISADGSNIYYDYSRDAVVDMLSAYLNPRVTALMKEAEQA